MSDRNIGAGSPFTDAIKGLITHAHLCIPLITKNAQQRLLGDWFVADPPSA